MVSRVGEDFFIEFIDGSWIEARFEKILNGVRYFRWIPMLTLRLDLPKEMKSDSFVGNNSHQIKTMNNTEILKQIAALTKQLGATDKEALILEIQNPSLSPEEVEQRKNEIKIKLDEISSLMGDVKRKLIVKAFDQDGFPSKILIKGTKVRGRMTRLTDDEWSKIYAELGDTFTAKDAGFAASKLGIVDKKINLKIKEMLGRSHNKVPGTAGPKTAYNKIKSKKK